MSPINEYADETPTVALAHTVTQSQHAKLAETISEVFSTEVAPAGYEINAPHMAISFTSLHDIYELTDNTPRVIRKIESVLSKMTDAGIEFDFKKSDEERYNILSDKEWADPNAEFQTFTHIVTINLNQPKLAEKLDRLKGKPELFASTIPSTKPATVEKGAIPL